ncbi:MAG: SAM-dependent methyltransferase [Spirochaetales bacterium]|nr:SAM-dependent methyltransferase [Spirochaetales bacterium]
MNEFKLKQIGVVERGEDGFMIKLDKEYHEGLTGIEGFSWLNILWWANQFDDSEFRKVLTTPKPYKKGPDKIGIFATRSPVRPNPIAVTPVYISRIDIEAGILYTPYIDAEEGTPVLDIKPYHGSSDRVDSWQVPSWCRHWPETVEDSASFNWGNEFNF